MVGNGIMTHAWEDTWDANGHLSRILTYRFINGHDLHNNSTVYDLRHKFGSAWPQEWINAYPQLQHIRIPTYSVEEDRIMWLGPNRAPMFFSVKMAWKSMEQVGPLFSWCKIVWHKAFIPRHALCLWMACHKRLPTQDRLCMWKNEPPDLKCMFCGVEIETHNHLFFDCNFSKIIWVTIKEEISLHTCPDNWDDIIIHWETGAWRGWSTLHKLAISATVYHIWMERNRKFFEGHNQSVDQVVKEITKEILMRMAWKTQMKMIHGDGNG